MDIDAGVDWLIRQLETADFSFFCQQTTVVRRLRRGSAQGTEKSGFITGLFAREDIEMGKRITSMPSIALFSLIITVFAVI